MKPIVAFSSSCGISSRFISSKSLVTEGNTPSISHETSKQTSSTSVVSQEEQSEQLIVKADTLFAELVAQTSP